jgi:HD-GYP domain-containing protein (c-di-GMP phosphodiesterase class II)
MYTNAGFGFLVLSLNIFAFLGSFITWKNSRRRVPGTAEWCAGFLLYFSAVLVLTVFCQIPFTNVRILSNVLETMGTVLMYLGYMRFFGRLRMIRDGLISAFILSLLLLSSSLLVSGKREWYLIVRYSSNLIPILGVMAVSLRSWVWRSSIRCYLLFVIIFLSFLMVMNISDNAYVLYTGSESVILSRFGSIGFFLGIIIVALLAFSQNQLANACLLSGLEQNLAELKRTNRDIIEIVSESLELRLSETSNHVKRVSSISRVILKKLGIPEDEAESISAAATLHDIGKIGIPDDILKSTERYGEREKAVMMTHTTMGYDILSASKTPLLQLAALISYEHHEHWDGTGYPCGKKGAEISLASRVVSVADTFDALVNRRAYKNAWSIDESIDYIVSHGGTLFDPEITAIISGCRDEFRDILKRSKAEDPELP